MEENLKIIIKLLHAELKNNLNYPEQDIKKVISFYHPIIAEKLDSKIANDMQNVIPEIVQEVIKLIKEDEESYFNEFYSVEI